MIWMYLYLAGVVISSVLYGFFKRAGDISPGQMGHMLNCALGWPILLLAAAGHASRLFSAKRRAEDDAS